MAPVAATSRARRLVPEAAMGLPLPEGEGRSERKGSGQRPTMSFFVGANSPPASISPLIRIAHTPIEPG